ncbi:MAG: phosphatidate cytidylyltransferase [Gammaproteobacteria bacterium HGW-Gammaproteobacteria-14]|nr:MAG: phosphatidate cytidylyltransferase [Gammaproteobacteria bacterium HGW-Gammaproteobacteria-14]
MLKLRIITALVLLPIVLGAMFFLERSGFALIAGVFFLAAGWEWSAMMGQRPLFQRLAWLVSLVGCMWLVEIYRPVWLLTWVPLLWVVGLVLVVGYPGSARFWRRPLVLMAVGLFLLVPSWAALVQIQSAGALGLAGPWALLFILLWVWAADTGAYFAGRAVGRHKLAPRVSPGKTIEGLIGGVILALLVVALVDWQMALSAASGPLLLVALVTVLASALGDLFESMIKREANIKDSGTLLPGHGGMLDRIDSVTAALPVAVAALTWAGLPGGL